MSFILALLLPTVARFDVPLTFFYGYNIILILGFW